MQILLLLLMVQFAYAKLPRVDCVEHVSLKEFAMIQLHYMDGDSRLVEHRCQVHYENSMENYCLKDTREVVDIMNDIQHHKIQNCCEDESLQDFYGEYIEPDDCDHTHTQFVDDHFDGKFDKMVDAMLVPWWRLFKTMNNVTEEVTTTTTTTTTPPTTAVNLKPQNGNKTPNSPKITQAPKKKPKKTDTSDKTYEWDVSGADRSYNVFVVALLIFGFILY